MDNPFQAPDVEPVESSQTKHQSFRLTPSDTSGQDLGDSPFSQAIVFALVQQLPFLFLSGMILDGGLVFKRVVVAAVVFWATVLVAMIQNRQNTSRVDILWIKWGFLPLVVVTFVLWLVVESFLI